MRVYVFGAAVCAVLLCLGVPVYAQPPDGVSGRLLNSLSGAPIPGAAGRHRRTAPRDDVGGRRHVFVCRRARRPVSPDGESRRLLVAPHRNRRGAVGAAGDTADRSGTALRRGGVGGRRSAQPVRFAAADLGVVRPGADEAARHLARPDPRKSGRRELAQLRAGAGAARDSRPRRRPRADPARRSAHGRFVEPVGRPRRGHQPGGGRAHRGRARSGHAALWRQRHRRSRQRDHQRHPDTGR